MDLETNPRSFRNDTWQLVVLVSNAKVSHILSLENVFTTADINMSDKDNSE